MYQKKWIILIASFLLSLSIYAQTIENEVLISPIIQFQTVEGFGASLAFYENWLIAHPNKKEIYEAIFGELSLDILRIRNAYDYDAEMIVRVGEFIQEAEASLGYPIKILSTSWGPPAYLKSNNDSKNGGTLKYSIPGTEVEFDYSGFAAWWEGALNEYNSNGIYPTYISIQNEPDFSASWESCLFNPEEKITSTDTIAGYNKALEAVYNMVEGRAFKPKLLSPESIGVGYNTVENYINQLNTSYIYGIAHHLYHGVDENDPWSSTDIAKVGNLHPEIPHFQTEFNRGDWFSLAGLIYKSFHDEQVVAYLYWDLIWDGSGLVNLEFPWDNSGWTSAKGYIKSKEFYAFKQFSAFIHPGWKRIGAYIDNNNIEVLAFLNSTEDSTSLVFINRSDVDSPSVIISIPGYTIDEAFVYRTSVDENCFYIGALNNSEVVLPSHSITTIEMSILEGNTNVAINKTRAANSIYPNPFSESATIRFSFKQCSKAFITVFDYQGRIMRKQNIGQVTTENQEFVVYRNGLDPGLYIYKIETVLGESTNGYFIITE
ncbi:MAG: T9SS type A sorting domain-containing protein [Bacteroidales bacterium]|nr:T9SS type A sorting domain-containing protein [Bacteroidales bacterium]